VYVLQYYMRHQILHAYKTTEIFSLFGRSVKNCEVTGFKMRRMLSGQFVRELQKFFCHPRSWECWQLRVNFPPNPRLKTILLGWKPPLVNRSVHRIVKSDYWLTLKEFSWIFCIFFENLKI
jgi:hypothetical protein